MDIRHATRADIPIILTFIKELAVYEKMADQVEATETALEKWLFDDPKAHVFVVFESRKAVGFSLYFTHFSTFKGKPGIYIEDIYIQKASRGKGYGKALFKRFAKMAKDEDYGRIEWSCLDWNTPSIEFYLSLGAKPMKGWSVYRLEGDTIDDLLT